MHLKILIGLLMLGLASASPEAAAKPVTKASPQDYSNGQAYYSPSNNFGQHYPAQAFPGQSPLGYYNVRYTPQTYGQSSGYPSNSLYQQPSSGNYYQQPQLIPVPVAYSGATNNGAYNRYNEGTRLWPKHLVSPTGSPSPVTETSSPLYYPSSSSSPATYEPAGSYPPFVRNSQYFGPTSSPVQAQYQRLIPVPVKVGSRNSFQPQALNYNTAPQLNAPASYFSNYQQATTAAPYLQQSYHQPTPSPYGAFQQPPTGVAYVAQYQQPTLAPYAAYYHKQPNAYQQAAVPQFPAYQQQQTGNPYAAQYQPPAGIYYSGNYQQPTGSPFPANYQRIPLPVGYPNDQIQPQPTNPTLTYYINPTGSYPNTPINSQPISVQPTSPTPPETVTITEKTYVPSPTTSTSTTKPKATIIKSEYNSGFVSPQYNLIPVYSTASPFGYTAGEYSPNSAGKVTYGLSYSTPKSLSAYPTTTAASQAGYDNIGTNFIYKK